MRISIIGLGYVGAVSAACLAYKGHKVIGVDNDPVRLRLIAAGNAPVIETGLADLIGEVVENGRLSVAHHLYEAITSTDISIVCVGTPSLADGSMDYTYMRQVCTEIGKALKTCQDFHVVVIRSTILPGTMQGVVIPLLEENSGKQAGIDFGVCNNPEFLREGSAIQDFWNPPKTVIGSSDACSAERVAKLYEGLPCPLFHCAVAVAEMAKYADNCWHAAKVTFANEIGAICKSSAIDSHQVMDIFCQDTKLNISPHYLKPGFAFGGSCLPKDIRALTSYAASESIATPLLSSLLPANDAHIERVMERIMIIPSSRIGILGISFKAGTNDLRESPVLELITRLMESGVTPVLYDHNVSKACKAGIPVPAFLGKLLADDLEQVVTECNLLIITYPDPEFLAIAPLLTKQHNVLDLVRIKEIEQSECSYHGICW